MIKDWTCMKTSSIKDWTMIKEARWTPPNLGKTNESSHIRWHIFATSIRVWDLTNAGKRGKKVDTFALWGLDYISDVDVQASLAKWIKNTLPKQNYKQALQFAKSTEQATHDRYPSLEIRQEMGVRVAPPGFGPFKLETPNVSIEADWDSFTVNDKIDQNNLPSCIPASKGGKASVKVFYRWVQDNQNRIKQMTFGQIQQEMRKAGIKSHYYCRMD